MKSSYKNKRRQKQRELKQLGKEFENDKKALVKEAKDVRRAKSEKRDVKKQLIQALPERREDEQDILRKQIAAKYSTYKKLENDDD
jgi:hypothetical protein